MEYNFIKVEPNCLEDSEVTTYVSHAGYQMDTRMNIKTENDEIREKCLSNWGVTLLERDQKREIKIEYEGPKECASELTSVENNLTNVKTEPDDRVHSGGIDIECTTRPDLAVDISHPSIMTKCQDFNKNTSKIGAKVKPGRSAPRGRRKSLNNKRVIYHSCTQCDYLTRHRACLLSHFLTHTDSKPFSCNVCEYTCKRMSQLKQHASIHSNEKPYSCDMCDYTFKGLGHLKRHALVHSNKKPYSCRQCDYTCRQNSELKKHALIHSNEKPYTCDECHYTFRQLGHLKRHAMIHSNVNPFACNMCDYKCRHLVSLKRHILKHSVE